MAHALTIERLGKRYGEVVALDGISLDVERGQFLTLLGPSGCGKTTLLMAIAGFAAADSGSIRLDGERIDHLPPERRNFGMVFQGYALFPHLTIAENVAFPLRIRRVGKPEMAKRVRLALEMVQLSGFADRMPRQLSGGQQQRAALARALVFEPNLVLLDEPLSALDKNLRTDLQVELKDLHQRLGVTFIYVTHDQQEALSMSDRIAILRDGRLVQQGTPAALYDRPTTRFAAGFLGRSNFIGGTVTAVSAEGFCYRRGAWDLTQAQRGALPDIGAAVLIAIRPEKIRVLDGGTAANRLSGRIVAWSYHGDAFQILLDVTGVGRLAVITPTWRTAVPETGAAIEVGWDDDAAIPVAED